MALEVQNNVHGIDKSYNEAKPQHSEQHARLLKETDDKDIRATLKADHEKASRQTADLPKIELVDTVKAGESGSAQSKNSEKSLEISAVEGGHAKRQGDSLPSIELVDSTSKTQDKTVSEERKEGNDQKDKSQAVSLPAGGEVERLQKAIEEVHSFSGRSRVNCEQDLRDTIATLNGEGVAKLDEDYQERFGKSLSATIEGDSRISSETKAALAIYMKGADNRTEQDTLELADLALQAKNLDIFQEAFREASEGARKQYIDRGGLVKIEEAFSKADQAHALDYVAAGKLSTVTKIHDNSSAFGDNEKAIDLAMKNMGDNERQAYVHGKALAEKFSEFLPGDKGIYDKLTPQEKADYDQYRQVHDALARVGNASEVLRWDDLAVNKEQTLVGKMAEHGGLVNDKVDKVFADIENMNESQFQRLKEDPRYRAEMEAAIAANYRGQDLEQARELLDKKLSFGTFEEAQVGGNRATVDALKNKFSIFGPDDQGILDALQKMSPDEQKRYREDTEYKKQIDGLVDSAFHNRMPEVDAKRILEDVSQGGKPQEDIVGKLAMHAYAFSNDKNAMLLEVESSLKQDPQLRERLLNPQTEADKVATRQFTEYARGTFGASDYEQYVKPLLEKGELPFAQKVALSDGAVNDDLKGVMAAIKTASVEERANIVAAPDKVLSFLGQEERQLAVSVAQHNGDLRPVDEMRAAVLGMSGDKEMIKDLGARLTEEQRIELAKNYENQFGKNLAGDLADKLSGQEEIDAVRNFKGLLQTARESFNDVRDEEYRSNDGIGRSFVRNMWDGTADASSDSLHQYAAAMTEYAKSNQEMPAEQSAKMASDLTSALALYRESKGAAADAIVDGTIIAAGVGGAAFTGGVSLGLVSTTGAAGALLKVGTKSAILGDDYDLASGQALTDAAFGAVDSATVVLGPVQMAKMLHLGEKASFSATEAVLSQSANIEANSGKQLLKEGAGETLSKDLANEVATGLAQGAREIDERVLDKLAQKYAASEAEQAEVKALITTSLNEAIAAESSSALKNTLRELALNSGAGSLAGGSSGLVEGARHWDSSKELGENLQVVGEQALAGSVMGGAMGTGATLGFKGLGKGFEGARNLARDFRAGNDDIGHVAGELLLDANGRIAQINGPNPAKISYHEGGSLDGVVKKVEMADGTSYESLDAGRWNVLDSAGTQVREVEAKVSVSHTGDIEIKQADGNIKTISGLNGWVKEFDKASGETFMRDRDGHLLSFEARNGHETKFQYDGQGQLSRAQFDNGHIIFSEDGGKSWLMKAPADAEAKALNGLVSIDADGTLRIKPSQVNGSEQGQIASGALEQQQMVFRKDGSYSHLDSVTGRPSDLVLASGRREQYEYAADGTLSRITINGRSEPVPPDELVTIAHDGTKSIIISDTEILNFTDGGRIVRNVESQRILQERPPENLHLARETHIDGKSLAEAIEQRKFIEKEFTSTKAIDAPASIKQVELELKAVKTTGADGQSATVYASLMGSETLSSLQKENVLRNLAQVREHLAGRQDGEGGGLQAGAAQSWLETEGAVAKVLDVAATHKLSARETEDALLASIYSHSMKPSALPGEGASAQSIAHNYDGALVAQHVLSRDGFSPQRVEGIVEAIEAKRNADLGNLPSERQLEPGFKQLSRAEQEEVLSRSRIEQTVLESDDSVRRLTADSTAMNSSEFKNSASGVNAVDSSLMQSRPLELPGIKPEDVKPGVPAFKSEEHHLEAWRSSDTYRLYVKDTQSEVMRTFGIGDRLLAFHSPERALKVNYDAAGEVESVLIKSRGDVEPRVLSAYGNEIKVDADGTVKLIRDGGNVERYNPDGSLELVRPSGRIEYLQADYAHEKSKLDSAVAKALEDQPDHLARMQNWVEQFEKEAAKEVRHLDENHKALLYRQLNRLLADNPEAALSPEARLALAEQALHHSARPWSVSQGQNNTCNVTTIEHRNYWRNPDKNVQMLADIANTGKYRFADGSEVDMRSASGELKMDAEAKIDMQRQRIGVRDENTEEFLTGSHATKIDGKRDFSSQLIEMAMIKNLWSQKEMKVDAEGRQLFLKDLTMHYNSEGEALGIVDHGKVVTLHDQSGNVVSEYKTGEQYYRADKTPIDGLSDGALLYDKNGGLHGFVSDVSDVKQAFDVNGRKISQDLDSAPISNKVFDENGNLLVLYSRPGDISYDKVTRAYGRDVERLLIDIEGRVTPLRSAEGVLINSPRIKAEELVQISNNVTGQAEKPFVIAYDKNVSSLINVQSQEEFLTQLRQLLREKGGPAIARVDASQPLFGQTPRYNPDGSSANGHVINVHGISKDGQRIFFTNQWKAENNALKDGVELEKFFEAMQPWPDKPAELH